MNLNKWLLSSKAFFLVLGSLALTSCATHTIKTLNQPSLQTGSPLKSVRALRVYVGEFEDVRGLAPGFVGFMPGGNKYNLDRSVSQVVRDSIQSEFQRNGHICLGTGQQSQADIVIEGSVYLYMFAWTPAEMTGHVGVKISVKAVSRPSDLFSKKYDGNYTLSGHVFSIGTDKPHKVLNEAHLNMLKEFTTDEEFLDFLKRTAP